MEDIKINKTEKIEVVKEVEIKEPVKKKGKLMKIFLWLAIVVIVAASLLFLPAAISSIKEKFSGGEVFMSGENSPYSAIFLDNGQVYFGEIISSNKEEMTLTNVFYLQVNDNAAQAELNQAQFNLIKLGTELHGPADILRINRAHIVFYEELRTDSKIVESIGSFKPQ